MTAAAINDLTIAIQATRFREARAYHATLARSIWRNFAKAGAIAKSSPAMTGLK